MWAIRGKAALHGRITTPLALVAHLALVGALAEVFVLLKEVLVAFLEQVHLGEEDLLLLRLRVLGLVDAAIKVAKGAPEAGTALLTELAVEDNDGARAHQLSQLGQVMQELPLQRLTVVDVYRTLDVPTSKFVVEAAVDDDCGVLLRLEQLGQRGGLNRVAAGVERLVVANQGEQLGLVVRLEKLVLDAKRID